MKETSSVYLKLFSRTDLSVLIVCQDKLFFTQNIPPELL